MAQNQDPKSTRAGQNNELSQVSRPSNESQQPPQPPATFSIATPAVTTILPITENLNDTSFVLPELSYQQDAMIEKSYCAEKDPVKFEEKNRETMSADKGKRSDSIVAEKELDVVQQCDQPTFKVNQPTASNISIVSPEDESSKVGKKRNKVTKKSTKLDAKSKLEKSRQSARECRARKKLRYQYLEDLVCNREKAVIKLREELSMFCELSKQIDVGTINDSDRRLLSDQTKENSRSESTSLL